MVVVVVGDSFLNVIFGAVVDYAQPCLLVGEKNSWDPQIVTRRLKKKMAVRVLFALTAWNLVGDPVAEADNKFTRVIASKLGGIKCDLQLRSFQSMTCMSPHRRADVGQEPQEYFRG